MVNLPSAAVREKKIKKIHFEVFRANSPNKMDPSLWKSMKTLPQNAVENCENFSYLCLWKMYNVTLFWFLELLFDTFGRSLNLLYILKIYFVKLWAYLDFTQYMLFRLTLVRFVLLNFCWIRVNVAFFDKFLWTLVSAYTFCTLSFVIISLTWLGTNTIIRQHFVFAYLCIYYRTCWFHIVVANLIGFTKTDFVKE